MGVSVSFDEGTFAYDRFLKRMSENGENWGRIWMSPWSFAIEWTNAYNRHFHGLGSYNLENSWRMDHVLDAARENKIYLMVLFTAHGEVGDYESDFKGPKGSPYYSGNGGPISDTSQFYTNATVSKYYRRKVRYILARWGYSSNVFAWEILNEPDLAKFYKRQPYPERAAEFVRNTIVYMRSVYPFKQMVTSGVFHVSAPHAGPVLSMPEIDFNTGHLFHGSIVEQLRNMLNLMTGKYGKIFLATEAGLTPFARDPDLTALNIRKTIWGSYMMPYAGAAAPWWWVLIDQRNLYPQFKALTDYAQGEDKRGKKLANEAVAVRDLSGKRSMQAVCLKSKSVAYGWVYDPVAFTTNYKWSLQIKGEVDVSVGSLENGNYHLEVWDTVTGKIVAKKELKVTANSVNFKTPAFASDLAFKLKKSD